MEYRLNLIRFLPYSTRSADTIMKWYTTGWKKHFQRLVFSGWRPKWKNILSGDLFFNILINGLAGMIEDMLATFTDDRKLRELENNHWTWIQHFVLLQSSKVQSREDTAQPAGCKTACPTWSKLHSAHQAWVPAAVLGHTFSWHAADIKTQHGQTTGRKWKGQPHEREVYEKRLEGLGCFSLDERLPESRIIIFKNGKVPSTKRENNPLYLLGLGQEQTGLIAAGVMSG